MLNAIKGMYSNTNVILSKIGIIRSTAGIRGTSSSAYIFIIFINGLFEYLRQRFENHKILGNLHNLIHADDTILLDTNSINMKSKVAAAMEFFQNIKQTINSGKTKYMVIDITMRNDLHIKNLDVSYSANEKYLGHNMT